MCLLFQFASFSLQDGSSMVRAEGCRILGTMERMPLSILLLTLCKKSSSHLPYYQQTLQDFGSTFAVFYSNQLSRLLDPNVSFGAFIHATEDEFAVVRNAAISIVS
jgi:hypothetical protein